MRTAIEKRKTKETNVSVKVNLDGTGSSSIATGIGFFDHMLTALSKYSMIDMQVTAKGDLETGTHHTMEDVGIVLGTALAKALGDKRGINRAGFSESPVLSFESRVSNEQNPRLKTVDTKPKIRDARLLDSGPIGKENSGTGRFKYMMDDAIAEAIIDLSGRGRLVFECCEGTELKFSSEFIGPAKSGFATGDVKEFFWALASNMKANIAIRLNRKGNSHHEIEATFKAFGKALRTAVENDPRTAGKVPSTKGVL